MIEQRIPRTASMPVVIAVVVAITAAAVDERERDAVPETPPMMSAVSG
jgi:hypothetical protein